MQNINQDKGVLEENSSLFLSYDDEFNDFFDDEDEYGFRCEFEDDMIYL